MALICLCGLDRTGKSTVASWYKEQGYEIVHLSAPDKKYSQTGYTGSSYFEDYVDMLMSFNGKDIIMDRFWDGELVWPQVYNRASLLSEDEIESIREIEVSMNVQYVLMHDPNVEAHWKRCVDNKEPMTKPQFIKARKLYNDLAEKYGFVKKTLKDFPEASQLAAQVTATISSATTPRAMSSNESISSTASPSDSRTPQQLKLDRANAINEVLAKRIIKGKGPAFDELERSVRGFLNTELGKLFGANPQAKQEFSSEEVELLKFFCQRLKSKENE